MKKLVCIVILVALVLGVAACGDEAQQEPSPSASQTAEPTAEPTSNLPNISLVMSGDNAFNRELAKQAELVAAQHQFEILPFFSDSSAQQETDLYTALGKGTKAIILMPVDPDNLQKVMENIEAQKIPVINILSPVNGVVQMLISPDFQNMGAIVAQAAAAIKPPGAKIFALEEEGNTFISQMIHDGLVAGAASQGNASIIKSAVVRNETEAVYTKTLEVLNSTEGINIVFAQSEEMLDGVLKAVLESGKEVSIITCGGSEATMQKITEGSVRASVFMSPRELAQLAVDNAFLIASDPAAQIPQYAGLQIQLITPENVAQYMVSGAYADIILPPQSTQEAPVPDQPAPPEAEQPQDAVVDPAA